MKKTNVLKGLLALAVVLLFAQCTEKKETSTEASAPAVAGTNMKIAYVEVDSLLTKYRYWNDLNELDDSERRKHPYYTERKKQKNWTGK